MSKLLLIKYAQNISFVLNYIIIYQAYIPKLIKVKYQ